MNTLHTQSENQSKQHSTAYIDRVNAIGNRIYEIIADYNKKPHDISRLTNKQILTLLSLQGENPTIKENTITLQKIKKRGKKLNINRFSKKFYSKEL